MNDARPIRCVIVDDEPLAVALIADYVSKTPGLETVLRTTHVLEALQAVQEGKADLIFLDVQMPELTGIQFMKIIRQACKVILTTAYAQYALDGYEHDVIDYLLKPVTLDRFMIAVQKAKERLHSHGNNIESSSQSQQQPSRIKEVSAHIFIKSEYRIQKVDLADIHYISALRDYIAVHTVTGKILSLESMRNMEELLPVQQFIRIHKSYIINRDRIEYIERGRVVINKEYLPIGDTYREKLMARLGI